MVIAIIAMLISILLPSLSEAREQAKTVKCVSNLKQIGTAMHSYFMDEGDWFPFEKRNQLNWMHGFYYGGHPGRPDWWGYKYKGFRDTLAGRPLNNYLYQNLPDYNVEPDDPEYEKLRDMPVFKCPSDEGGFWNSSSNPDPHNRSLYSDVGTSYDCNYHFVMNWARSKVPANGPWLQQANAFVRMQLQYDASRFIILYEDPFDSAQWLDIPRRGWHKKWMKHSFLFLDSHAANILADTTKGKSGTGWKSCSGSYSDDPKAWWNDKNDPDYRFRDIAPLPGG